MATENRKFQTRNQKQNNKEVREATRHLLEVVIPEFAMELEKRYSNCENTDDSSSIPLQKKNGILMDDRNMKYQRDIPPREEDEDSSSNNNNNNNNNSSSSYYQRNNVNNNINDNINNGRQVLQLKEELHAKGINLRYVCPEPIFVNMISNVAIAD